MTHRPTEADFLSSELRDMHTVEPASTKRRVRAEIEAALPEYRRRLRNENAELKQIARLMRSIKTGG